MTTIERERCDWSDLHKDECAHCLTGRAPVPRTKATMLAELRLEVIAALEAKGVTVTYPLPIDRAGGLKPAISNTPRWNPGNVAAQIGGDLTLISNMFAALREEAETRHSDREFPGGDAMVMLGPGADVEAWGYAQISAMVGRISEDDIVVPTKEDIEPPLSFLAGWTDIIRAERDQPTYLVARIDSEIKYIRDSIEWMFSLDDNGDMRFIQVDDLAAGLGKVRRRMEDILKDGSRAEFTRVNCIAEKCQSHPRLMKLWTAQVRWDRYRCPDCRTDYDKAQYELAKAQNLHSRGLERFITPRDASEGAKVPIKTVYSWMKRRKAERVWITPVDGNPFAHVWWPDVRDLATERTARLNRQAIRRAEFKAEKEAEAERKAAAKEAEDSQAKAS